MRIISIQKGFACDHSSTSYEFLAVDKPLDKKARRDVSSLSSRASPTERHVSFIYHADGYDIPGGWEKLMQQHYDVMYSESYDWWTLAMAFDAPKKQQEVISRYEFTGADDLGVYIACHGKRVIVAVHCRANHDFLYDIGFGHGGDNYDYYNDEYDDEEDDDDLETGDGLLDLLVQVRQQLIESDYRALYAVWEVYGWEDDEDDIDEPTPPKPPGQKRGKDVVDEFRSFLAPA